jgi:hypothetical protein
MGCEDVGYIEIAQFRVPCEALDSTNEHTGPLKSGNFLSS